MREERSEPLLRVDRCRRALRLRKTRPGGDVARGPPREGAVLHVDDLLGPGRHEAQPLPRDAFDPGKGGDAGALHLELPLTFGEPFLLLLEPFDLVPESERLDVRPDRRKENRQGRQRGEEEREELPGPPSVRLADEVDVLDGAADCVHGASAGPRRPGGDSLRHPEPRRARPAVVEDFLRRRADRLLRDEGEDAPARADADRERRGAAAPGRSVAEDVLHDPVFERVVRKDRDARAELGERGVGLSGVAALLSPSQLAETLSKIAPIAGWSEGMSGKSRLLMDFILLFPIRGWMERNCCRS